MSLIDILLRRDKGSPLLNDEVDSNFENLQQGVDLASSDWYQEDEPLAPIPGMLWTPPSTGITFVRSPDNSSWLPRSHKFQDLTGYSPVASFKNKIINGDFRVRQRGETFTIASSGVYTLDRVAIYQEGAAPGDLVVSASSLIPPSIHQDALSAAVNMARSFGSVATEFVQSAQRIEDARTCAGKRVTLSFWIMAESAIDFTTEVVQFFGTGGSPSPAVTGIGAIKRSVPTGWSYMEHTFDIPSTEGKSFGTNGDSYLGVNFYFAAGSNHAARSLSLGAQPAGVRRITCLQLEEGPYATPFEQRPVGLEAMLCRRYYEFGSASYKGIGNYGQAYYRPFVVPKRSVPTMAITSASYSGPVTGATLENAGMYGFGAAADWGGSIEYGSFSIGWTADAEL